MKRDPILQISERIKACREAADLEQTYVAERLSTLAPSSLRDLAWLEMVHGIR